MNRHTLILASLAVALALSGAGAWAHGHGQDKDHSAEHDNAAKTRTMPSKETKKPTMNAVELYIIAPLDGAVVSSPVRVQFGLRGMGIAPAGADLKNTGHHHLLVDVDELPNLDAPLPATDNVRHFGGGQTEASIELKPGEHSLQLLLGDFLHRPHNPPVISEKIRITVEDGG